jgi:hypothetical protein
MIIRIHSRVNTMAYCRKTCHGSWFFPHKIHLEDPKAFVKQDPHLRQLQNQPLVHRSNLLDELPREKPGIYTIGAAVRLARRLL